MKIVAEGLGKRFNLNWIFRNYNYVFEQGKSYAVIGPNGSGKSTFLQVLTGVIPPSAGKIEYSSNSKAIDPDNFYKFLSIATPYLELIEEFTLKEHIAFHFKFKSVSASVKKDEILDRIGLAKAANREIRFFSSGMKQRVKLALAFFSDSPVLFLDEPTSNLDKQGIQWYRQELLPILKDRLVLIGSNQEIEYDFCDQKILMG